MVEEHQPIFALDIGTRSVVGLILHKNQSNYHVIDLVRLEHAERSMLDGQIHNVTAVANVITQVKEELEKRHGKLQSVCVAAAGRSLKTIRSKYQMDIKGQPILDHQVIFHLELSAVQSAQYTLAKEYDDNQKKMNDYCVGYSVIEYRLDNEQIGSLVDQKGDIAAVEVIATFLPKVVVESLISALQRSGLALEALTLEPIAAIHVLIPTSMRRLNVALVDVGAGTSDIAITNFGTVMAYGMVPVAGDEITEAISDHYLLDFPKAEVLKREISSENTVTITDILGFEAIYTKEEVIHSVEDAINNLAKKISEEIIKLNQQSPKAVMLVGGGSMTPLLPEKIAHYLNLPINRVAIRGVDAIQGVTFEEIMDSTPELVTPIGIAIAAKESPVEYISIIVNEQTVRLFDMKSLTVGDGLLSSGTDLSNLYGKPGMGMMVNVNGRVISVPGEHGTAPLLKKNGVDTELDEPLNHGDVIEVRKGYNGKNAEATIGDFFDEIQPFSITFNNVDTVINPLFHLNQSPALYDTPVNDRDYIMYYFPEKAEEIVKYVVPEFNSQSEKIAIIIDGETQIIKDPTHQVFINNKEATLLDTVRPGDSLSYMEPGRNNLCLKDVLNQLQWDWQKSIYVTFNNEHVKLEWQMIDVYRGDEKVTVHSEIKRGDKLRTRKKEEHSFIFQDVFAKVTIQRPSNQNKKPIILRNHEETNFSVPIAHGDELELTWVD